MAAWEVIRFPTLLDRKAARAVAVLEALTYTREVPVVNWSRRILRFAGHERRRAKNHSITRSVFSYPR